MDERNRNSMILTVALEPQQEHDEPPKHDIDPIDPPKKELELETTNEKQPQPPAQEETHAVVQRSAAKSVIIVMVATLSMIINIGNVAAMSITLPTIGMEFHADPLLLQWIVSAYSLSSGCLLLVFGRLADIHGRKKAYLVGTFVLAAFTLGCGFANDVLTLIILRAFQGIGAAATIPASAGILAHAFPPSRARSLAFATFSAGAAIGAVFGNITGGVLTEKTAATWRSPLFLFAGINVLCLVGGALAIDKDVPNTVEDDKIDWLGAFTITAALVLILFVLGEGEGAPKKWATGYIIALLIVGVFLVGVFIYWQWFLERAQNRRETKRDAILLPAGHESGGPRRGVDKLADRWGSRLPPPVMKLSLWARANGRFAAVMAIAFTTWSGFIAWYFWAQLYYQDYTHLRPLGVVVRLLPMFVAGIIGNTLVGFMASRVPMIVITTVGTLGTAGAAILFALIDPRATYWAFGFPATVLSVLGVDFVFAAGSLYVAKVSLPHEQSFASALFQTMTQLGTSAGVTISTVVFNRVSSSLHEGEDLLRSYKAAQWTGFAFAAFAALLSLAVFQGVGVPGHKKEEQQPVVVQDGKVDNTKVDSTKADSVKADEEV